MKRFLLALSLLMVFTVASAQVNRSKWTTDMLATKHQMIIEELSLTPSQQKEFMPLYEAMEKEIYQCNRNARTIAATVEKKANPKDSEYQQAADALSNAKVREGEIEAKYYAKFSKILSKKQLFQLKQTEANFARKMLSNSKQKKK